MSLTVAVQMDPLEKIGIAGDSTFALMVKAQERGHRLFHYLAEDLSYEDGRVRARARPVEVQRVEGSHFTAGDFQLLDLTTDVDVVLMRQDPPFDIGYITATYLLERVARDTLVVNDPRSVRDAPEKLFVLDFARFMRRFHSPKRAENYRPFIDPTRWTLTPEAEKLNVRQWQNAKAVKRTAKASLPDVR